MILCYAFIRTFILKTCLISEKRYFLCIHTYYLSVFQVIKYEVGGHYHAHHDSEDTEYAPCCHLTQDSDELCRPCRCDIIIIITYTSLDKQTETTENDMALNLYNLANLQNEYPEICLSRTLLGEDIWVE